MKPPKAREKVSLKDLFEQGQALLASRRFAEAEKIAQHITKIAPKQSFAWALLAETENHLGKFNGALTHASKAVALDPSNASHLIQKARAALVCGRIDEARGLAREAVNLVEEVPDLYVALSLIFANCLDYEQALWAVEKAVAANGSHPTYAHHLALCFRTLGRLDEAERACDRALELAPDNAEIILVRSSLRAQTKDQNHVDWLRNRLAKGVPHDEIAVHINYALAKELEDLKDYEASFAALDVGARLKRKSYRYKAAEDEALFDALIKTYTKPAFQADTCGHDSFEPIFVLGMPRTGTTLVERILGSHSKVFGAGELLQFGVEFSQQIKKTFPPEKLQTREDYVGAGLLINHKALGHSYIKATRPLTGNTPHFVDKLPLNCLHVGLIHLALPNAKIILVKRHPLDACYAIYKNLFNKAYPFSYNLREIGRYYLGYDKLMAHWCSVLPGRMIEISYEDLVSDQEAQSRALLAACNLEWEAEVLEFFNNKDGSSTASAAQIRQPIYVSSVEKWRHFEAQLAPLIEILEEGGVALS